MKRYRPKERRKSGRPKGPASRRKWIKSYTRTMAGKKIKVRGFYKRQ